MLHHGAHAVQDDHMIVNGRIRDSISTKCQTYSVINPNMTIHGVEMGISHYEHYQITCLSHFRMSAHVLRVEMGRWQRIPHDQRVCTCSCDHGGVQAERHVIEQCTYIYDLTSMLKHLSRLSCEPASASYHSWHLAMENVQ